MEYPGFIGGAYQLDSVAADLQRCVNFFPEPNEKGDGRSPMVLRGTPGLTLYTTLGQKSISAVAAVVNGGTSYTDGDILTVVGGTGTAATLKVTAAAGVISTAVVQTGGLYTVFPTVAPATVTGGTGNDDATFTLTTFEVSIGRTLGAIICYGVNNGAPRVFMVGGTTAGNAYLFEINSDGSYTNRGTLSAALWAGQAFMAYNETQLCISCGAQELFIFTFATNVLAQNAVGFTSPHVVYIDGYFVATSADSSERQRFYISALKDGTVWAALDFEEADAEPDIITSMVVQHNELWMFGQNGTMPYFNSGNADFPLEPIKGQFMEGGCGAQASAIKVGGTLIWMGHEVSGRGVVWRADGYRLSRISTYAIEEAIRSYSGSPAGITDAVAWSYQDQGHIFYVLCFPTAGKTWVYDLSTELWHERMFLSGSSETAHLGICHVFAWWETTPFRGKHLVGARNSGIVYEMNDTFYDDNGATIRRIRRAPHLHGNGKRVFYSYIEVGLEVGLATNQRLNLRYSDTAGKTYESYKAVNVGPTVSSAGVTAAAIVSGGTAYTNNDVLTVVGGDGTAATLTATVVAGEVTVISVTTAGAYTGNPANPVSVTGGSGSGATFNLSIPSLQLARARWPFQGSARDRVYELMVEDAVRWTLNDAQIGAVGAE